jgi:integrase
MGTYFNLSYKKSRNQYNKNDILSVQVYYYYSKRKVNFSTGIKVRIKDWDDNWREKRNKNPIKRTDENHQSKNIIIKQKVKEVEDIINKIVLENLKPNVELVKTYINRRKSIKQKKSYKNVDFRYMLEIFEKSIDEDVTKRDSYKKSIRNGLRRLNDFTNQYESKLDYRLKISDIDEEFQNQFLIFLTKKEEQPSTIRKRLKLLVSIINWCKKNGFSNHQIKIIKFNHDYDKDVIYLLREEVLKLYQFTKFNFTSPNYSKYTNVVITDKLKNYKVRTYTNYEVYRDMIVFGCGVGCRYGDLVNLKLDNYQFSKDRTKGFFVFRMSKSRVGKQVKVPINNLTFNIWKKYSKNKRRTDYLFPRTKTGNPISNQKINKHLKTIGEIVELKRLVSNPKFNIEGKIVNGTDTRVPLYDLLTSHIIRRTFIREGIENNIPTHTLMSMSGHTTEKVFRKYFSTTTKELDEGGKKMFSFNLKENTNEDVNHKEEINSIEEKLLNLKNLYEKGLIPEKIYHERVSELI